MDVDEASPLTTPLESNSLLLSISYQQHLLSELLSHLSAMAISYLISTSSSLKAEVTLLLPIVLRERGQPMGTSLRTLGRVELAIFRDDFRSLDAWECGPSKLPPNRRSYRTLAAQSQVQEDDIPEVSSSAVDRSLPLEPGCHAIDRSRGQEHPPVLVIRPAAWSPSNMLGGILGGNNRKWTVRALWPTADAATSADAVERKKRKGKPYNVKESHLRLIFHPRWGEAGEHRPRHYLRLEGGWRMNFSGMYRHFSPSIKPRRISYSIRLREGCGSRSFFNFFLSSADVPYADEAVFYAGSPYHPAEPLDTFTLLWDANPANGRSEPMLWLPSGHNGACRPGSGFAVDEWHRVSLEFCWSDMTLLWFVDGQVMNVDGVPLPFGPHAELLRIAFGGVDSPGRADAQRLVREQLAGFSRLYLFTWLERPAEQDCPDVSVADLWIEGDGSKDGPPPDFGRGAALMMGPALPLLPAGAAIAGQEADAEEEEGDVHSWDDGDEQEDDGEDVDDEELEEEEQEVDEEVEQGDEAEVLAS